MAKTVKDSKGRDCTILEITDENRKQVRAEAKSVGYDITRRRIGGQRVPCVLVPASQAVHDTIYRSEDAEQKRRVRAERPMIPNGKGKLKRCPTVIPNPEYNGQEGVKKTVKNDCMKCERRDVCDWWKNNQTESLEDAQENAGDASNVAREIEDKTTAGLMPEDERFERARAEILSMIEEKYPDYYEVFDLLLDGVSRNKVLEDEKVQERGITKSNLYNMPKDMVNALVDLFDDLLWYIDADVSKFRK